MSIEKSLLSAFTCSLTLVISIVLLFSTFIGDRVSNFNKVSVVFINIITPPLLIFLFNFLSVFLLFLIIEYLLNFILFFVDRKVSYINIMLDFCSSSLDLTS